MTDRLRKAIESGAVPAELPDGLGCGDYEPRLEVQPQWLIEAVLLKRVRDLKSDPDIYVCHIEFGDGARWYVFDSHPSRAEDRDDFEDASIGSGDTRMDALLDALERIAANASARWINPDEVVAVVPPDASVNSRGGLLGYLPSMGIEGEQIRLGDCFGVECDPRMTLHAHWSPPLWTYKLKDGRTVVVEGEATWKMEIVR